MSRRYAALRRDRRKDDWHRLTMGLVVLVIGVTCYLAGFIVVLLLVPHLSPWLVAKIVGLAYVAAGGGMAAWWTGRARKRRYDRRPTSISS